MKTPYELFGWEIGKGWHPLVKELMEELEKFGWDGDIVQIKEKFGGLRFYIGTGSNEIFDKIHEYEERSYKICEECGTTENVKVGKSEQSAWIKTLCHSCREKRDELYSNSIYILP